MARRVPGPRRSVAFSRPWRVLALSLALVAAARPATAAGPEPLSSLRLPDRPSPAYVTAAATVGGTLAHDWLRGGAAVGVLFRPDAAAQFFGPLHDWGTGLALQGEWRSVDRGRRLFALTATLRRYLRVPRAGEPGVSPFVGVGFGGAEGTTPAAADSAGARAWLALAEAGWESSPDGRALFFLKAQWHLWRKGDLDYSGWSFHLGAGVPIPW